MQPVVKPVVQPVWQPAVSCKRGFRHLERMTTDIEAEITRTNRGLVIRRVAKKRVNIANDV